MKTYFSPSRKGLFNIPVGDDCILLSEETANTLLAAMAEGKLLDADNEGNPITVDAPRVPTQEEQYLALPIAERLTVQLGKLNRDYDEVVAMLSRDYPTSEIQTWTIQVTEARAYKQWADAGRSGDAPATPFLTQLNAGRVEAGVGEGFDDLVDRILANDAVYSPVIAGYTAYRHGIEKQLTEAAYLEDEDGFNAITWVFPLPTGQVGS